MSDETREKNVTTKVCNAYRTYRTSKMLIDTGKVGNGLMRSDEMIGKWSECEIGENVRI